MKYILFAFLSWLSLLFAVAILLLIVILVRKLYKLIFPGLDLDDMISWAHKMYSNNDYPPKYR